MKKMIIYIIIGLIVIGIFGTLGYMRYVTIHSPSIIGGGYDQKLQRIVEYRDFSCPGMEGFTFKYPVFLGWEVKEVKKASDTECLIEFNFPDNVNLYQPPKIIVKTTLFKLSDHFGDNKNPNGVWYSVSTKDENLLYFYTPYRVEMNLISLPSSYGFSKETFAKIVIDSFKLTK